MPPPRPRRASTPRPAPGEAPPPGAVPGASALGITLGAVLALHVAATLLPSNWLWGVDAFRYWPAPAAMVLVLLGACGFVPALGRQLETRIEQLGRAWERGGLTADLAVALLLAFLILGLRDSVRFTGDFDLRVSAIDYPRPPIQLFPQAAPLDLALNFYTPRFLVGLGWTPAVALQAVGAVVGGAFALACLALLRAVGVRGAALPAAALVVFGGGYLQHFAGYDKFGPLLFGVALAGYGAVRLWRGAGSAWALVAGTAICVLSHRSGLLFLPAAGWVLFGALRAEPEKRGRAGLLFAALALLIVTFAVLPRMLGVLISVDWKVHLPGGAVARSFESPDAPGMLVRVSDLLNALLFLAPLWPAAVVAASAAKGGVRVRPPSKAPRFRLGWVFLLALGPQVGVLIAAGATRGSGRDWDAAAAAGVVAGLATAGALAAAWRDSRGAGLAPGVTVAVAVAIGLWGSHASEAMSLRRVRALLEARPGWSDAARAHAHDFLGLRAYAFGRFDEAAREFERAIAVAPNPRYFHQLGLAALGAGQVAPAREAFRRSAALAPANTDPWLGLANAALAERDTASATAYLDSVLIRSPLEAQALELRRALGAGKGTP